MKRPIYNNNIETGRAPYVYLQNYNNNDDNTQLSQHKHSYPSHRYTNDKNLLYLLILF